MRIIMTARPTALPTRCKVREGATWPGVHVYTFIDTCVCVYVCGVRVRGRHLARTQGDIWCRSYNLGQNPKTNTLSRSGAEDVDVYGPKVPEELMATLLHPPVALRREDDEDYVRRSRAMCSILNPHS